MNLYLAFLNSMKSLKQFLFSCNASLAFRNRLQPALQLSPLRAAYFLGDLVGNGLGYLPAVFDRFPRLTILPLNSFADRCADPVSLRDNLAGSVLDLVPFRGADFLRLLNTIALVLALVFPDRGANIRSGLPWLTLLSFDSFAHRVADPISLGDILANLV